MKKKRNLIGGFVVIAVMSLAALAFADYGYGYHMGGYGGYGMGSGMMGPGYYGGHMMGSAMMGTGYYGDHMMDWGDGYGSHMRDYDVDNHLSASQRVALDKAQEKFDNETQGLLKKIDEKQFALHNELIKNNPDKERVIDLQKEISKLQAKFDQKSIRHELEIRKIIPENVQDPHYSAWYGGREPYCW